MKFFYAPAPCLRYDEKGSRRRAGYFKPGRPEDPMQEALSPNQKILTSRVWLMAVGVSLCVHVISAGWLFRLTTEQISPDLEPIKVKVVVSEPKVVDVLPPKPKKREKPKPQTLAPNAAVTPDTPVTDTPIQGLTKDSFAEQGTIAAPVGNTLMKEDEGKRLEQVDALRGDMSAPARLITKTLTAPPYTNEALDAALEGSFIVDVFVNLDGTVRDAELRKKIGYGMDNRVLAAVLSSKFTPRKNKLGVAEEGWTELRFTLVIP
jgi:outer membrane biosynthesis protein TonB